MNPAVAEKIEDAICIKDSKLAQVSAALQSHIRDVGCARPANRRIAMKKVLGIVVLLTVTMAQAWIQDANACTYDGYPCSQWEQQHDGW
jgi:hypothetical protein